MLYNEFSLPNGLRIIHEPTSSKVAYCGLAINAGTRDELSDEKGMAHFVEHLIFKGTTKRKAWHILNRMENVGGDLDAYTNKEETVVYAAFLSEHLERAVELLADIVFHSTFPKQEIEKETDVIFDEIESYKDSPSELIYDEFEGMLFRNHPLGENVLGDPEQLRTFTPEKALAFTRRLYQPGNMILFVQGNFNFKKIVRLAEKYLTVIPAMKVENKRLPPSIYIPEKSVVDKGTHQAHVIIGRRSYSAHERKRIALCLLNNVLGGPGMNSRLNVILRERHGLVYNVESNLSSYTDTGVFSIYFGTDNKDIDACLNLVRAELNRMRELKFTSLQLIAAKKQLIGQIGVGSDNNENNALDMSKIYLHYNKYETAESVFKRVEMLTSDDLLTVANEMFDESSLSVLIYK
ncbi:MAG: pitrilysin family protein [Bacteroidaceae bacterium]|nr:insulinase family protein [Bacteroidaceae bacterium]